MIYVLCVMRYGINTFFFAVSFLSFIFSCVFVFFFFLVCARDSYDINDILRLFAFLPPAMKQTDTTKIKLAKIQKFTNEANETKF